MRGAARLLSAYEGISFARSLRSRGWAQTAVVACFAALSCAIAAGALFFFLWAFRVMLEDAVAGPVVARFAIEAVLAATFALGVASVVFSAASMIFSPGLSPAVDCAPVGSASAFMSRFAGVAALSAWPVALIGAPAVAALATVRGATVEYAAFAVVALGLFCIAVALTGALASFIFVPIARRFSGAWGALALSMLVVLLGVVYAGTASPTFSPRLFIATTANQAQGAADDVVAAFAWWPSHPFASVIASPLPYGEGLAVAPRSLAWIFTVLAAAFVVVYATAAAFYHPMLQSARERRSGVTAGWAPRKFPTLFTWRHGFLYEKTLRELFRNGKDASYVVFLSLLLAACIGVLKVGAGLGAAPAQPAILSAAFAVVGFFALIVALRFAFPAVSRERRRGWPVLSSPLHFHEVFSWQLFFWSTFIAAFVGLASGAFLFLYRPAFPVAAMFLLSAIAAGAVVVAICLGFGTAYPPAHDEDPEAAATSPSGIAATLISLGYLAVIDGYVRRFGAAFEATGHVSTVDIFGAAVVSAAVAGWMWFMGTKASERVEAA